MNDKKSALDQALTRIKGKLRQLATERACFIKQGKCYPMGKQQSNKNAWLAVVGIEYYRVVHKTYPITKRKALLNIVRREFAHDGYQQVTLGDIVDGKRAVRILRFDKALTALLPASVRLVVPEHDVALPAAASCGIEYQLAQRNYWFARVSGQVQGAVSGGVLQSRESFALSVGAGGHTTWQSVNFEQYLTHISGRLTHLQWQHVTSYWVPTGQKFDVKTLAPPAVVAALLLLVYFVGVNIWLTNSNAALRSQAMALSSQAAEVFEVEAKISSLTDRIKQLTSLLEQADMNPQIWVVIAELSESGVNVFRTIYSDQTGFIIEGEAENATAVLSQVRANDVVSDAGFNNPTVETQGVERFSIALTLADSTGRQRSLQAQEAEMQQPAAAEQEAQPAQQEQQQTPGVSDVNPEDLPADIREKLGLGDGNNE